LGQNTGGVSSATTLAPAVEIAPSWPRDTVQTSSGPLTIVPIRHASVLFLFENNAIYVDPTSEGHYEGLPKANFVFVTHSHPDHLDEKQIRAIKLDSTSIFMPPDAAKSTGAVRSMKNGDSRMFGSFMVEAVPAYNIVRGPVQGQLYHPKGQGNGYIFTFGEKRIYVSGDTECIPEMKALNNIDVAFICMRLPYTMPPTEAAECIKAFQPKIVYPYHYQTSNLDELKSALKDHPAIDVRIRDWYREDPPTGGTSLSSMLPDNAGPFTAGTLVADRQFVRREYSRGSTKISVTIAVAGATPMNYDEWVRMSGTSPAVRLDVPANSGAGFYDCDAAGPEAVCNVHIHLRSGYHIELMGQGKAHRADFQALLRGLPMRALATTPL
jgi:L-ascorbate metabolism protein UlaG (beta-lactamase superfamily)